MNGAHSRAWALATKAIQPRPSKLVLGDTVNFLKYTGLKLNRVFTLSCVCVHPLPLSFLLSLYSCCSSPVCLIMASPELHGVPPHVMEKIRALEEELNEGELN